MNIGLLAMSGIRVCDQELLKLGLTLPGFVDRSRIIASLPSLGLLQLAACTPPGHEVHYDEAEGDGKEPAAIYGCDLVAISTFSAQIHEAYAVADRLRARGVKVAMGGLHVSACPDEAAAHADYVVVGEGEPAWPHVVDDAARRRPPTRIDARRIGIADLTELPPPRYELLIAGHKATGYNRFTVQTTRGCPWRCEFCASTVMLGNPYRRRPVAHVVRDVQRVIDLFSGDHGRPFIEFADDNTFVDRNWGKQLCRALIPLKVKWFTETDVSVAEDEELLELMRQAGCRQVLIGLESPTRAPLEGIELRSNFKARTGDRYAAAIRAIQGHGITVNGCFVLGLDGQDDSVFQDVMDFAAEHSLYDVQITVLTPFPGTPLYERLLSDGRILEPGRWDRCTLFDINYRPHRMSPQRLRDGLHWLCQQLYCESATRRRREGFFRGLRHDLSEA